MSRVLKFSMSSLLLAAAACSAGDDVNDGTRAQGAEGGALEACPEAQRTPEGAGWRLVDCGAIPVRRSDNGLDWGRCVDGIDQVTADRQRLIIDCIAVSTCDELKVGGSPNGPYEDLRCFQLGGL